MGDFKVISKVKDSAVDVVINNIKRLIISKQIDIGDKLPSEFELAEMMGVSRGSVREAMKILNAIGVVEIKRGDGTYVTQDTSRAIIDPLMFKMLTSEASLRELVELREFIEMAVGDLIVANATQEDIKLLEIINQDMKDVYSKKGNCVELGKMDILFHKTMGKITNNVLVEMIYSYVVDFLGATIEATYQNYKENAKYSITVHEEMIEAFKKKDREYATEKVKNSIKQWKQLTTQYGRGAL
ncbi:MAG TPA: GntR family transcriptional regulator [Clostridia bacterium]|nr:GntR family transcriptional regulator [Clostridia bacterium]